MIYREIGRSGINCPCWGWGGTSSCLMAVRGAFRGVRADPPGGYDVRPRSGRRPHGRLPTTEGRSGAHPAADRARPSRLPQRLFGSKSIPLPCLANRGFQLQFVLVSVPKLRRAGKRAHITLRHKMASPANSKASPFFSPRGARQPVPKAERNRREKFKG